MMWEACAAKITALGGEVIAMNATLLDGSPLPDWLSFDGFTGKFAGKLPPGMVASVTPFDPGADDIATGSLPPVRALIAATLVRGSSMSARCVPVMPVIDT